MIGRCQQEDVLMKRQWIQDRSLRTGVLFYMQDPYVIRPLPHLIGSRAFYQDDDVGIGDMLGSGGCTEATNCATCCPSFDMN